MVGDERAFRTAAATQRTLSINRSLRYVLIRNDLHITPEHCHLLLCARMPAGDAGVHRVQLEEEHETHRRFGQQETFCALRSKFVMSAETPKGSPRATPVPPRMKRPEKVAESPVRRRKTLYKSPSKFIHPIRKQKTGGQSLTREAISIDQIKDLDKL